MNHPSVFISYNPNSDVEQTLAIRLHTIGSVSGFNMILPDRGFSAMVTSPETRGRIQLSDYFIVFSTERISDVVQEEINIAFTKNKDRSRILVVYDKRNGRNLSGAENCTEVSIDTRDNADIIVNQIASKLKSVQPRNEESNGFLSVLGNILLIGVGLFALTEIFENEPKRTPRKRPSPKKRKSRSNV